MADLPGIPFQRWSADKKYLVIGPGVESSNFRIDNPEVDLLATTVLAVQAGTGRFVARSIGGGSGEVTGPNGATNTAIVIFEGPTGDLVQNSVVTISGGGALAGATSITGPLAITNVTSINGAPFPAGALGDVVGPAGATDKAAARYDTTTGKLIQNSTLVVGDTGAVSGITSITGPVTITGVTTINGSPVPPGGLGDVAGPASATDKAVALYNTASGKLIRNSAVTISDTGVVAGITTIAGPLALTNVTSINGGAVPPGGVGDVVGPAGATADTLVAYSGATGKLIKGTTVTVVGGAVSGVATLNGVAPSAFGNVVGPGGATANTLATYSGTTGKLIQDSAVVVVSGDISAATTLNGNVIPSPIGNVTGPVGATDTALALYNGVTGKAIKNSIVTLDNAGNMAGVLGIASSAGLGIGSTPYFVRASAAGTVASTSVFGPWSPAPTCPYAIVRAGNTVTLTLGPCIALNNGAFGAISFDIPILNSYKPPTYQNGTVLVRDAGVDKFVIWSILSGGPFSLSNSLSNSLPHGSTVGFSGGSTGQTGFPNAIVVTWQTS